jgi:hypothetical protein
MLEVILQNFFHNQNWVLDFGFGGWFGIVIYPVCKEHEQSMVFQRIDHRLFKNVKRFVLKASGCSTLGR